GRLDLGQVDRGESSFGVGREREAQYLDEDFGGWTGAVLEEIDEDLVSHGGHGGEVRRRWERRNMWCPICWDELVFSAWVVAMLSYRPRESLPTSHVWPRTKHC